MKRIFQPALLFAIAAFLVFIGACKKSSSVNGLVAQTNETYTTNGNAQITQTIYSYDGQGRQIEAVSSGYNNSTTSYSYTAPGKVFKTAGTNTITFTLNSEGLASFDGIINYTYTNGYLTAQVDSFSPDSNVVNTISDGNITNIKITLNTTIYNFAYAYTTVKDYRNYGLSFLGKTNTDNVLQETTGGTVISYAYTYDGEGRVHQQIQTIPSGLTTDTITYTYVGN